MRQTAVAHIVTFWRANPFFISIEMLCSKNQKGLQFAAIPENVYTFSEN